MLVLHQGVAISNSLIARTKKIQYIRRQSKLHKTCMQYCHINKLALFGPAQPYRLYLWHATVYRVHRLRQYAWCLAYTPTDNYGEYFMALNMIVNYTNVYNLYDDYIKSYRIYLAKLE